MMGEKDLIRYALEKTLVFKSDTFSVNFEVPHRQSGLTPMLWFHAFDPDYCYRLSFGEIWNKTQEDIDMFFHVAENARSIEDAKFFFEG